MKRFIYTFYFLFPVLSYAQALGRNTTETIGSFIISVTEVIDLALPILELLAFVVFFWGLSKFILNSDKQAEIENGKNYMMWGILALFILLSFTAIIGYIKGDLFGDGSVDRGSILLPTGRGGNTPVVTDSVDYRLGDGTVLNQ